jgi:hypothetical protein
VATPMATWMGKECILVEVWRLTCYKTMVHTRCARIQYHIGEQIVRNQLDGMGYLKPIQDVIYTIYICEDTSNQSGKRLWNACPDTLIPLSCKREINLESKKKKTRCKRTEGCEPQDIDGLETNKLTRRSLHRSVTVGELNLVWWKINYLNYLMYRRPSAHYHSSGRMGRTSQDNSSLEHFL